MTSDTRDTEDIVDICRNYWRFDHSQQHTHSWHDREDFLRDHLVPFLRQHEKLRRERDDATADRDRLAAIVERARNGYPQLIDWIDDFMAAAAAAEGGE